MTSRRSILIEALDAWRAEGALDDATWQRLRERAGSDASDAPFVTAVADEGARRSFVSDAMQFIGGLLLGAAVLALLLFLGVEDAPLGWALWAIGTVGCAGGLLAMRTLPAERAGLVEAAFAASLVPLGVAAGLSVGEETRILAILVTLVGLGVHILKRGAGATIPLCAIVVTLGSLAAIQIGLFDATEGKLSSVAWLVALVGYLALTMIWRREAWTEATLAALVVPLTIAYAMVLNAYGDSNNSVVLELLIGAFLGVLLGVGLYRGSRGLVAGAGVGLTIDAVVFAFDVGGPGTAVILLLALGGLLVWQAELLKRFFRARPDGTR